MAKANEKKEEKKTRNEEMSNSQKANDLSFLFGAGSLGSLSVVRAARMFYLLR